MRVVFMGSGSFAVPSLEALVRSGHTVLAAVAQPDREKGRGRQIAAPPVKPAAAALGLRVLQPPRVRDAQVLDELRALAPDVQVVVAYGQILPQPLIDVPRLGTVNVHASLLPKLRGAAPIQWAIANGEAETGVTTMLIDAGLDTGPTLLSRTCAIEPDERSPQLESRLAVLGADLLIETLAGLEAGSVTPAPQDHARATLAPLLRKEDGRVDWTQPAAWITNRVRGFDPWPGMTTTWAGHGLRLINVRPEEAGVSTARVGTILAADAEGLVVACGAGTALRLLQVQPESRRPMAAAAFAAGARLRPRDRFAE